ncbi:hypothetical protein LF887_08490 [Chryseobacterium sp. MEBOG06]|uniref:hypothetical protein n=1 Tax=Chryseobacterium sp. MEBOG06 TaxID=2879938 RepID=UPI001F165A66|nr:hypothetical protein [Chryseobacterium sp. MEBOG06]UKB85645.1 hypothetical protein LF887_08490 [Chryseobacterium sp. MEBOG06]
MIAPEYFNNHVAVEGEIVVKSVPNDAGFVLVWNPATKKISQRTNSEIIADLNLVTGSNENFFSNNKISSRAIGNVATTLDAELPNGGFISSYNTGGWGGADRPVGASYGGYIKFKGYFADINNLDLYYNNGHDGTEPRLWFRTKEGVNGVREWSELLHTRNLGSANLITNDQEPVNLFAKENKFGWINGALSGAGGINTWVGNYLSIGGNNLEHKSQLLVSKERLLFRGNHGNEDTSFNEVYHTGNFNPNNYSQINHSHQSLSSPESGVVDANSLFEDYKLKLNHKIHDGSANMFPIVDNANSIVSIASHPGGYGVQLGFNDNEGAFFRSVAAGNFGNWKQFAYRDWVSAQINNQALNFVPYTGATQDVNLGAKDLEFDGGGAISKLQNRVRIFNKVYQGYYDTGGHTGILAIKMPQASPNQVMFSIDINIYGYESQYLGKVNVAFYKYVSGAIISNGSKAIWEVTDNFPTTTARVGIGTDGYLSILLGESDTFWNGYFSFEVAKVEAKYENYNLDWNVGWSHAIESNFDLYANNIIVLPSDVVATRSWLTNFVDNNYIPRSVQYNNNFNSLGGYSSSGIYRANNDAGGVYHLYSPMLHMGAQDTTAQLQVKYNDGDASAGELVYRGGYNGNWTVWRKAWDNVNFKPSDYQTRNTDEIISAAKSYYNRIPFKLKNSSYKSWSIQKPTNNNLKFVPSVSKNAEDWDLGNSVEFTDAGQVSSKGFNKIGYNDNYILTAGGGHRLASDFVSSSALGDYLRKDGDTMTGALNIISPFIGSWRGTAIGGNYMSWQKYDGSKNIAYIGADGGAAYGGGSGDSFAVRATGAGGDLLLASDSGSVKIQGAIPWTANNFNPDSKINSAENAQIVGFSSGLSAGAPYIYHRTDGYVFLATQSWVSSNFANQALSILPEGEDGQWINLTNSTGVLATNYFITSRDGTRDPNTVVKPNSNGRRVRFDFINAGHVGGSGNYAGLMTYSPWDGTSGSTGDSSYQLAFANKTGINGDGAPMLKIRKGIDDKWSSTWYKLWSDADFSQSQVNAWNSMSSNGIIVNQKFTNYSSNRLIVVDDLHGGESGIYDENEETYLTVLQDEYYKYSSGYFDWNGINFNKKSKRIGIGTKANNTHKVNISGSLNVSESVDVSGSVNVLGSVKAFKNFKSEYEDPNSLFIADGSLSYLNDEIVNEDSRMRLSHTRIEQQSGVYYYGSDSRMLAIRCTDPSSFFSLKECFPGQRILVLNAHPKGAQEFRIESAGQAFKIPPFTSIQLFVWDEKSVYKYAENQMY